MKNLFFFLIFAVIIVPLLVFSYLGFVPGLSDLLASNLPKDLGITYSQQDLDEANNLFRVDFQTLPLNSVDEFKFSGKNHHVSQTLTSSQLTAWVSFRTWKYYPFSNLQIKLDQDRQAQVSGNVDIKKLVNYFQVLGGLSSDETTKISSHIPLSGTPAFYLDFTGEVEDNQISLKFNQVKIGKLIIPNAFVSSYTRRLAEFIEKNTLTHPSVNIKQLKSVDGQLKVVGTLPDIEYVK